MKYMCIRSATRARRPREALTDPCAHRVQPAVERNRNNFLFQSGCFYGVVKQIFVSSAAFWMRQQRNLPPTIRDDTGQSWTELFGLAKFMNQGSEGVLNKETMSISILIKLLLNNLCATKFVYQWKAIYQWGGRGLFTSGNLSKSQLLQGGKRLERIET